MCPKFSDKEGPSQVTTMVSSEASEGTGKPEFMDCSFGSNSEGFLLHPMVQIILGDQDYQDVIDTGCTQTPVKATLILADMGRPTSPSSLTCVHEDKQVYSQSKLSLTV